VATTKCILQVTVSSTVENISNDSHNGRSCRYLIRHVTQTKSSAGFNYCGGIRVTEVNECACHLSATVATSAQWQISNPKSTQRKSIIPARRIHYSTVRRIACKEYHAFRLNNSITVTSLKLTVYWLGRRFQSAKRGSGIGQLGQLGCLTNDTAYEHGPRGGVHGGVRNDERVQTVVLDQLLILFGIVRLEWWPMRRYTCSCSNTETTYNETLLSLHFHERMAIPQANGGGVEQCPEEPTEAERPAIAELGVAEVGLLLGCGIINNDGGGNENIHEDTNNGSPTVYCGNSGLYVGGVSKIYHRKTANSRTTESGKMNWSCHQRVSLFCLCINKFIYNHTFPFYHDKSDAQTEVTYSVASIKYIFWHFVPLFKLNNHCSGVNWEITKADPPQNMFYFAEGEPTEWVPNWTCPHCFIISSDVSQVRQLIKMALMHDVEVNPGPNQALMCITINCRGLGNIDKFRLLLNKAYEYIRNGAVVICLQETMIVSDRYLELAWRGSPCHGTSHKEH
jgi:hypothetical protein